MLCSNFLPERESRLLLPLASNGNSKINKLFERLTKGAAPEAEVKRLSIGKHCNFMMGKCALYFLTLNSIFHVDNVDMQFAIQENKMYRSRSSFLTED